MNRVCEHRFVEMNTVLNTVKTEFSNKEMISLFDIDHNY